MPSAAGTIKRIAKTACFGSEAAAPVSCSIGRVTAVANQDKVVRNFSISLWVSRGYLAI
jgi:hypothetical protein